MTSWFKVLSSFNVWFRGTGRGFGKAPLQKHKRWQQLGWLRGQRRISRQISVDKKNVNRELATDKSLIDREKKSMQQIGITIVLSFIIASCGREIPLTESELLLNPYQTGQGLVFQSNSGKTDTTIVRGYRKGFPDAPGPLKYYDQRLHVFSVDGGEILALLAKTPDEDTRFFFHAIVSNTSFCCNYFDLKVLNNLPEETLIINGREYNDVIKIQNDSSEFSVDSNFIKSLYWSKKHGYVRLDVKNGETWSLMEIFEVEFRYRNGIEFTQVVNKN